jgi:hypothetical protein
VLDDSNNAHRDHFVNSVIDPATGQSLEYRHLIKGPDAKHYLQANINEIGRLTDGRVGGTEITGTNTGKFIHPSQLPPGRTATYLRPVVTYRRQKADPYRMRWTVGGNLINYPGITSTPNSLRGPTDKHRSPQHMLAWVTLNVHLLLFCSPLMRCPLQDYGHLSHHTTS